MYDTYSNNEFYFIYSIMYPSLFVCIVIMTHPSSDTTTAEQPMTLFPRESPAPAATPTVEQLRTTTRTTSPC